MQHRLEQLIDYTTNGQRAKFARKMGWMPQYVHNLLLGKSMGLQPVIAILTKFPDINARWLLLGEGEMLTASPDTLEVVEQQLHDLANRIAELRVTKPVEHPKLDKNLTQQNTAHAND